MSKRIPIISFPFLLHEIEMERIKRTWDAAMATGSPIVIGGGAEIKVIEVDDDTLRCEYCLNPIDKCGCGAARVSRAT